jgi:hypothetical protein
MRWRDYVYWTGESVTEIWRTLSTDRERRILFILGHGFDSRMCLGLEAVLASGQTTACDVLLLVFDEGPESASRAHADSRDANEQRLNAVVATSGAKVQRRQLQLVSDDGRRIGGRNVARQFGPADFASYTDVIVDVSALPRGLYFPLLAKLLTVVDAMARDGDVRNLHVMVSHSPELDAAIQDEGVDEDATFLHGFSAAEFEREATRDQPRVWLPVLGSSQRIQLERILSLVAPDEICPVLPSPARNPRTSDDLILEYRELLFDRLRVEPRNIIYASESNPFEVYRQIVRSVSHYRRALGPLSGCKAVLSAMSSKLASVGALLAAYELRSGSDKSDVGVAHVEAHGYVLRADVEPVACTLYALPIAGEFYVQ